MMHHTHYEAKVSGVAWSGYKAHTSLRFDEQPTRAQILAKAGDFQTVRHIEVVKVEHTFSRVSIAA